MGHMLSTMNPVAAGRLQNPIPLPRVGHMVLFFPRPSEIRQGRASVPALVLKSDEPNHRLDLLVIYDAEDFHSLQSIPRKVGDDRGWDIVDDADGGGDAMAALEGFKAEMADVLFGNLLKPSIPICEQLADLAQRVRVIEQAQRTPAPPKGNKRK